MKIKQIGLSLVVVSVLGLGFIGCGSGSDDTATPTTETKIDSNTITVDKNFISTNGTYKVVTPNETKEITSSLNLEDTENIFIADGNNNIRTYISSDFKEINAENSAISLLMLASPRQITDRTEFIKQLKEVYSNEILELATTIKNSQTLDSIEVINKLDETLLIIQNNSSNTRQLRSLLNSNANWLSDTENSHIPIKVVNVKSISDTTEQVTLEIFNKYSHWRELYITDKNNNKIDTTSYPIAPNSTDKFLSTISTISGVKTYFSDIYRGIFDDNFSLASEGTLNSTKTTVILTLPKDAKNIVVTPHSDIAKVFNMYHYAVSFIDASGLSLGLVDFFKDIGARSEDITNLTLLWETDKEQALKNMIETLGLYTADQISNSIIELLTKKLIAIPNATSATTSALTTFISSNHTSEIVIPIPQETTTRLTDGLVAHYEFEGNANDSSGNGNHGTEYGGVSYVDGVIGKAGSFDGVDDWIKINYNNNLALSEWTISTWIKVSDFPNDGTVIIASNENDNNKYNYALILRDESISSQYETSNNEYDHKVYGTSLNYNEWIYIVSTRTNLGVHKVYVNSVLENSSTWNNTPSLNDSYLMIAKDFDSSNTIEYLNSKIDDLRIYNRALSESEIQELYNLGK